MDSSLSIIAYLSTLAMMFAYIAFATRTIRIFTVVASVVSISLMVGSGYGATFAFLVAAIFCLSPLAMPLITYPIERLQLLSAEMKYGQSGIQIRFDWLSGYRAVLG